MDIEKPIELVPFHEYVLSTLKEAARDRNEAAVVQVAHLLGFVVIPRGHVATVAETFKETLGHWGFQRGTFYLPGERAIILRAHAALAQQATANDEETVKDPTSENDLEFDDGC